MSIRARDNGFGSHEFSHDIRLVNRQDYSNGESYQQSHDERLYDHYCERYGHSNNPLVPLVPGADPSWRAPSNYSRNIWEYKYQIGTAITNQWSGGIFTSEIVSKADTSSSRWTGGRFSIGGGGPPWPDDLESRAIAEGLQNIKDGFASLGEDLAESRQTYGMLVGAVRTLGGALWAVKKGNIGEAISIIRDPRGIVKQGANLYLQYQYGWKPLVTEVWDAANRFWSPKPRVPLMRYRRHLHPMDLTYYPPSGYDGGGTVKLKGSLVFYYMLNNNVLGRTMDQIGLSNPLSLGWNLIPYSFVVDWALPIGPMLDSLTPPQGTEFVGGACTATWEGSGYHSVIANYTGDPARSDFQVYAIERRKYDSWPHAGLYVKSPFSLSHGLSSIALWLQNLLK